LKLVVDQDQGREDSRREEQGLAELAATRGIARPARELLEEEEARGERDRRGDLGRDGKRERCEGDGTGDRGPGTGAGAAATVTASGRRSRRVMGVIASTTKNGLSVRCPSPVATVS
jgi:hypothetical protein